LRAAIGLQQENIMLRHSRWSYVALGLVVALGASCAAYVALSADAAPEAPFLGENRAAMDTMMAGMAVKPSGDVDVDFAAMMIPHHQGAIDMAQAELRHGHNEQLRRIAQEIVVDQQQEIAAMHLALGEPPPALSAAPDQPSDLTAGAFAPAMLPMTICEGTRR
jgi:hypothetical protein